MNSSFEQIPNIHQESAKKFIRRKELKADSVIKVFSKKNFVLRKELQQARQILLELDAPQYKTLFYPGAGTDWSPLLCLSDQCNIFIFCDWAKNSDSVAKEIAIGSGFHQCSQCELDEKTVNSLNDTTFLDGKEGDFSSNSYLNCSNDIQEHPNSDHIPRWGKYYKFQRSGPREEREIHAFFFGIEGLTLFANLFLPLEKGSPEVLCLINSSGGQSDNWTDFRISTNPFMKLLEDNNLWPKYLIAHDGDKGDWIKYKQLAKPLSLWPFAEKIGSPVSMWNKE